MPGEGGVGPQDRGARGDPGPPVLVQHLDPHPVAAHVDQDVLALRLAVERGAAARKTTSRSCSRA
ncbi:hypothetical protein WP39_01580 [Streptomyces sp. 604F]|nr:hypothetical protein [Streptomyces sp. 604F]